MSEMSPEQKAALEEQKKNCIFCKLISGEIPAKKVYEDELVIAILDINPLGKGHMLVMPKEHHPIMPLIPPETFKHMFSTVNELAAAAKKALLMTGSTVFIANGYIAGQMSPHFMFHIIPREEGDGVELFKTEGRSEQLDDSVIQSIKHNLPIMMENHFKRNPADWHKPKEMGPQTYSKDQVIQIIEQNPQLKQLIEQNPQELVKQIGMNDQLKQLFSKVDIDEVILHFNKDYQAGVANGEAKEAKLQSVDDDVKAAAATMFGASSGAEPEVQPAQDIYDIISHSEKLKALVLGDRAELIAKIESVQMLKDIFEGHDVDEVIAHFRRIEAGDVPEASEEDFDAIDSEPGVGENPVPVKGEEQFDPSEEKFASGQGNIEEPTVESDNSAESSDLDVEGNEEADEPVNEVVTEADSEQKDTSDVEAEVDALQNEESDGRETFDVGSVLDEGGSGLKEPDADIINVIEGNPKLKMLVEEQPELFKQKVAEIPQIAAIFNGYDLDLIIEYFRPKPQVVESVDNSQSEGFDEGDLEDLL